MRQVVISIETHGKIQKAKIEYDDRKMTLNFKSDHITSKTYKSDDIYCCLALLRADYPDIKFLCKGAKINVFPSRMSSQMSSGMVAYEMRMGWTAENEDRVRIFDYEDTDITSDYREQKEFYKRWINSFQDNMPEQTGDLSITDINITPIK